ncbi:dihydrolipoamide succinyltransferase [Anaeromyxobacter sp. Red801]|uniref:dihydrolipoamide succinyltransferase n=1 Tax=Anaeromyxobacter sp. Red801 TaxID=3411632 RepID=UPI003BA13A9D
MSRTQRTLLAVLLVAFAAGLALLGVFADRDPRGLAAGPAVAPPTVAAVPEPSAPGVAPAPAPAPAPPAPAPGTAALRPGGVDRSPQRAMPAQRRHALASFRRELAGGMAALRQRAQRCAPPGGAGASVLVALETVEGGIRVLDARAQAPGSATEAEVSCARAALAGQVLPAPSAEPGRRWQLPLPLVPGA